MEFNIILFLILIKLVVSIGSKRLSVLVEKLHGMKF